MLVRILKKPSQLRGTAFHNWAPTYGRDIVPKGPPPPHTGVAKMGPNSSLDTVHGPGKGSACCRGERRGPSGNRRGAPSETSPRIQATQKRSTPRMRDIRLRNGRRDICRRIPNSAFIRELLSFLIAESLLTGPLPQGNGGLRGAPRSFGRREIPRRFTLLPSSRIIPIRAQERKRGMSRKAPAGNIRDDFVIPGLIRIIPAICSDRPSFLSFGPGAFPAPSSPCAIGISGLSFPKGRRPICAESIIHPFT